jgi:arylsulfatase A-like enzyme
MMSGLDDNVGKVLNALRAKKLEENTLVFFVSDNGGPTMKGTAANGSRNGPLRGSKRTTLEGGIRVPFFVRWPGHVPAGKVYDQPVIQLDILPTALAAAGIEVGADLKLDGVDLLPHFNDKVDAAPHDTLYWRFGPQMAIRRGNWKLVRYDPAVDGATGRATDAKLYNLKDDIGETKDLIRKEAQKAKELQAAWDEWNESNIPPLWGNAAVTKEAGAPKSKKAAPRAKAAPSVGE